MHPLQPVDGAVALLEHLRVDPVDPHPDVVGDAAVGEAFGQRLVGVEEPGVLADDRDQRLPFRALDPGHDLLPDAEIGRRRLREAEVAADLIVQALLVVADRHGVDAGDVQRRDDRLVLDVAKERDLAPFRLRQRPLGAAQQQVRLDADAEQLLHRMLRRLGLELAGGGEIGQQGDVDVHRPLGAELVAELADRLEERQAFDVADGAADLAEHEVLAGEVAADELLDGVGDVRDHLDGGAQVVAVALAGDHLGIDAPGGDVVAAPRRDAGEALVMAEVEVGLGAVVGDVDLAVLIGAHRPRIDVDVGVELAQPDLEAAGLQQRAQRRRGQALAEGGDHAAGNEDEPRHGPRVYARRRRRRKARRGG